MQPKMALLMIFAVSAATSCLAAPSINNFDALTRPSPINPAIPMDPKPEETITVITDPKELAKFKREIGNDDMASYTITAPTTVKPVLTHFEQQENQQQHEKFDQTQNHHRERRDIETSTQSVLPSKPLAAPAKVDSSTIVPSKRNRKRTVSTSSTTTAAAIIKHRQKRADTVNTSEAVPLIYRDEHKEPIHKEQSASVAPQTVPAPLHAPAHQTQLTNLPSHEAQHFPQYYDAQQHVEMKRDIPVPLVPKYHHPEESPKEEDKQGEQSSTSTTIATPKSENSKKHPSDDVVQVEDLNNLNQRHLAHSSSTTSTEHPIFRHRPVPVAELFANAKTTSTTEQAHQQTHLSS